MFEQSIYARARRARETRTCIVESRYNRGPNMHRYSLVTLAVFLSLLPTRHSSAQDEGTDPKAASRALIGVAPDTQIAGRIRGQTADLAWQMTFVPIGAPETAEEAADRRDWAKRFAARHRVSLVIWFDADAAGPVRLLAYDVPGQALWIRDVAADDTLHDDSRWASSAHDEAAALMIRGILQTLSAARETPPANPLPPPEPSRPPIDATPQAAGQLLFAAGWELGADGLGPWPQHAVSMGIGWAQPGWETRLEASLGLPAEVQADQSRIALQRRRIRLLLLPLRLRTNNLVICAGGGVGVWQMERSTVEVPDTWQATPDAALWGPQLSLDAKLRWTPSHLSPVGLELQLNLDGLPRAVSLRYATGPETQRWRQSWHIQPRLGLSVVVGGTP